MAGGDAAVTGRQRVAAAYKGGYADVVPAYPIAGSFAGCLEGLSIEEYCTNPTKATRAMLNYYDRYQPDIMIAFNDLAKEVEALGCHVKYSDYVVPSIDQHVLQDDKAQAGPAGDPRSPPRRTPAGFPAAVRGALRGEVSQRAGRGPGGAVDDRHAAAQPRADVSRHARRPRSRPRADALLHRVRQAMGGRRAGHADRPQLHRPDRVVFAGGPRHVSGVHQALPSGSGGPLPGQEGRHDHSHLRNDPPDPRGPRRRRLRGRHHRPRPAGRSRPEGRSSSTGW